MAVDDRQLYQAQLEPAVTVDDAAPAEAVDVDGWVVIVGVRGEPQGAVPPGALARDPANDRVGDLVERLPGFVLADLTTRIEAVLDQVTENALEPDVAVVVIDRDTNEISGVSTPRALRGQLHRINYGASLPGPMSIPHLMRRCQYLPVNLPCGYMRAFPRRPATMPRCADPQHLGTHDFVW